MNRRVEIILERYKDDYPAAMGELNIRKFKLIKRIDNGVCGKERRLVLNELNDICRLLFAYQNSRYNELKG